jgi:hypothetical protein
LENYTTITAAELYESYEKPPFLSHLKWKIITYIYIWTQIKKIFIWKLWEKRDLQHYDLRISKLRSFLYLKNNITF